MSKVEKFARIIVKRTIIPGLSATTAPSDDHTLLPAWSTSDVYVGEFFLNEIDEKLWLRTNATSIRRILTDLDLVSGGTGGATSLAELTDVSLSGLTNGDLLIYNGVNWVNSAFTFNVQVSGISFAPNTGLEFQGVTNVAQTIYNTLLDPSLTTPAAVGGIPLGTTVQSLTGKSFVGIIDDLLFPTVLPTYTIPTITITSPISITQEIGVTIAPVLTLNGTKNDAGIYSALNLLRGVTTISTGPIVAISAASIASQFGYVDPNNPNSGYTLTFTDSYVVPATVTTTPSSTVYSGNGTYGAGLAKKNNKGVFDVRAFALRSVNAPQLGGAGFSTSSNITISGYYPYFYGTGSTSLTPAQIVTIIQSGSGFTNVIADGGNTLTMNFNAVGQWPWFAIFSPYPNKTKWYEDALNNGNIGTSGADLFSSSTTLSINSPNGYWSGINFKIYVAQKVTTLGICEIRVS